MTRRFDKGLFLLVGVTIALGCWSCAAADAGGDYAGGGGTAAPKIDEAQSALADHRVAEANQLYRESLERDPGNGVAAAGAALTDVMLLPGSDAMNALLQGHLGASGEFDAQKVVYAEEGFLYWLSRGATWEGTGQGVGIKRQISEDLPWSDEQLDSTENFLAPLTKPVGTAREDVVALAERLSTIEGHLETALNDEDFDRIVIPGDAFHEGSALTLKLGKSEVATVAALMAAARGALLYLTPYRYDWSLRTAFNEPCSAIDSPPGRWTTNDCSIDFLDGRWFRSVEGDPSRFEGARDAFAKSLGYAEKAITHGLDQRKAAQRGEAGPTTLQWHKIDDVTFAKNVRGFLGSVRKALRSEGYAELQGVQTQDGGRVSANFGQLFDASQILDEGLRWMVERMYEQPDGYADDYYWEVNPQATQVFFIDGTFRPSVDINQNENELQMALGTAPNRQTDLDAFLEKLFSELGNALDNAYFESR